MSRTSKHTPDIKSSEGVYMDVRENDESCDLQVSEVNAAYIPFEESVVTPRGLDDRKRTSRIHQYEEVETDGLNVTILPENPNKQQERVKNHQYEEIELEDGQVTFIDSSIVARGDSDHPGGESKNLLKHLPVANENVSEDQSGCFCRTKPRSENEFNEHPRIKSAIEQEFSYTEKAGIMKRPQRHSYYNVECVFEGHVDQEGYRSFTSAVKFNDSSEMESGPSELICRDDQVEHARGVELLEKNVLDPSSHKDIPSNHINISYDDNCSRSLSGTQSDSEYRESDIRNNETYSKAVYDSTSVKILSASSGNEDNDDRKTVFTNSLKISSSRISVEPYEIVDIISSESLQEQNLNEGKVNTEKDNLDQKVTFQKEDSCGQLEIGEINCDHNKHYYLELTADEQDIHLLKQQKVREKEAKSKILSNDIEQGCTATTEVNKDCGTCNIQGDTLSETDKAEKKSSKVGFLVKSKQKILEKCQGVSNRVSLLLSQSTSRYIISEF